MRGILRQMSLLKYSNILTFYDKIGMNFTLKNVKKGKARTQEHSEGTGQY